MSGPRPPAARPVGVLGRSATRTVDAATDQGSIPSASRILDCFLRAHQAATPPSLSAGPWQALLAGERSSRSLFYGIGSLLATGGVRHDALILLKRIPRRREGVGERNFF